MNLGQLLTEFYANGFDYLNDGASGATRATRWINQSYQELCALERWPFLEATATGPAPLSVPTLLEVLTVVDTTNTNTTLIEADQVELANTGDLTSTGTPIFYYITGGTTVSVWPVATNSLSVRYTAQPSDLAAAGDTPIVPAPYHDIIVLGAVRRALLDDTDSGSYQLIKAEWNDRVQQMVASQLNPITRQYVTGASDDW